MTYRSRTAALATLVTLAAALVALAVAEVRLRAAARAAVESELRRALEQLAPEGARLVVLPVADADAEIRRWAAASGLRVTVIARDGRVVVDSWTLPELLDRLENHGERPEIRAAAAGSVTVVRRRSSTTDRATVYAARALEPESAGFLRVARREPARPLPWAGALAALAGALLSGRIARLWERRRHAAVGRHLLPWADLPPQSDLAALAEEADRSFREQHETAAREVEAMRAALAEVGEGVVLLDAQGLVRYANPAAVAMLGGDLAVSRPLVEAARAPELVAAVGAVLRSGRASHTSVPVDGGGELAVRVCPVAHSLLAAAVVLRDVREHRQLERARRALVADLAHELRTPLTVLGGLAEELRDGAHEGELIASLERQVARLRTFAEDLEELVALESGEVRLHVERVDVAAVARQVLADLEGEARGAGVTLAASGAAELETDPVRLAQVLTNLCHNGIRYNRPGGHVEVRAEDAGEDLLIHVADDGIGIPAAEIPLVFQRFYRVRRGAGPAGGSGLGLAIVKHLMRALGGSVSLFSREGAGTTVTLSFPRPPAASA